jgi:hypothetical protein
MMPLGPRLSQPHTYSPGIGASPSCSKTLLRPHRRASVVESSPGVSPTLQTLQDPILLLPWACIHSPVRVGHHAFSCVEWDAGHGNPLVADAP